MNWYEIKPPERHIELSSLEREKEREIGKQTDVKG